ncbi:WcaF family extracellular polysaccharide biosynthesis acetyltransferase [Flavobacterium hibisci]|uniref:WcaF family extracellular polysaccharide biosynthesis acetyltransferase n=1 Tax=Flavobacterium hibisci TaxID=1914462 RepID=UPI001CBB75F3|nr:WcaF family extracellular polysaccharide biosynthesis acetyltransferase [Flavobacterium hibisci]MBZ4043045.1 WcaF family extracellular polysaccharide biosynthesis acetyltransferase [Flavobacterium hibisci]
MTNSNISHTRLDQFDPSVGLNRGVSKYKEIFWYIIKMFFFLSALPYPSQFKCSLLRYFGATVGEGVIIKPRVNIHFPWKLQIGNSVWIGEEAFLLNFEFLKIGNNVCISQRAFLCGGNHDYKVPSMPYRNGIITLEDGCWVGANVFVAPNVIIGLDTVVIAGSVVTKPLEPNKIYGGNPAKLIKDRW